MKETGSLLIAHVFCRIASFIVPTGEKQKVV